MLDELKVLTKSLKSHEGVMLPASDFILQKRNEVRTVERAIILSLFHATKYHLD